MSWLAVAFASVLLVLGPLGRSLIADENPQPDIGTGTTGDCTSTSGPSGGGDCIDCDEDGPRFDDWQCISGSVSIPNPVISAPAICIGGTISAGIDEGGVTKTPAQKSRDIEYRCQPAEVDGPFDVNLQTTMSWTITGPDAQPVTGSGYVSSATRSTAGNGTITFKLDATTAEPTLCGVNSPVTKSVNFKVFEVAGASANESATVKELTGAQWTAANQRFYIAAKKENGKVTVNAEANPGVSNESELPECWSVTASSGCIGTSKLTRDVPLDAAGTFTVTFAAGTSWKSATIYVVEITGPDKTCYGREETFSVNPSLFSVTWSGGETPETDTVANFATKWTTQAGAIKTVTATIAGVLSATKEVKVFKVDTLAPDGQSGTKIQWNDDGPDMATYVVPWSSSGPVVVKATPLPAAEANQLPDCWQALTGGPASSTGTKLLRSLPMDPQESIITCTVGTQVKKCRIFVVKATLEYVKFVTDHGILKDNNSNYNDSNGNTFQLRGWQANPWKYEPVTHSWDQNAAVKVSLKLEPSGIFNSKLEGYGGQGIDFTTVNPNFEWVSPSHFDSEAIVISQSAFGKKIRKVSKSVPWKLTLATTPQVVFNVGNNNWHDIYVTWSTPAPQDAPTWKRIDYMVDYVASGSTSEDDTVQLCADDAFSRFGLGRYSVSNEGTWGLSTTWQILDKNDKSDCISVVRFMKDQIRLLGLSGGTEGYVFPRTGSWVQPSLYYQSSAPPDTSGNEGTIHNQNNPTSHTPLAFYRISTRRVDVVTTIPPQTRYSWNPEIFEAYLKREGKYFPGGWPGGINTPASSPGEVYLRMVGNGANVFGQDYQAWSPPPFGTVSIPLPLGPPPLP